MSDSITILAPAKINIFLNVLSKREDGYHDIESIFQTIGIFDRLNVKKNEPDGDERLITVNCDDASLCGENNIVFRAAAAFFECCKIEKFNVEFYISKRIPKMSGLGGGSSDAAAAIIAMNELYATGFSIVEMCEIGASVGSDVPFLIKKGTCFVGGRGEIIESCTPMPECVITVAVPKGVNISTKHAYEMIDGIGETAGIGGMEDALLECSLEKIGENMFNKFERILPQDSKIFDIKKKLADAGSRAVLMSGSGSAVFALYEDAQSAKKAASLLECEAETFVCAPVRRAYSYIEK